MMRDDEFGEDAIDRPMRLAIGRVRIGSVARVGFSIGWIVSLIPALLTSGVVAWILHGIWSTLDGWTPWTPWSPNTRIAGIALPTPEFRPREALRVEGLYTMLAPLGQHPYLGAALGTIALTIVGGTIFAIIFILAGWAYNLFAHVTGGLEVEMVPRGPRRPRAAEIAPGPRAPRAPRAPRRERDRLREDDQRLRW